MIEPGLETLFVGRHDALQALRAAFDAAAAGRGGLVAVYGEPGIGKTRCAEAFARQMEDQGALVLWARCLEQAGAPAFWPWRQILREFTDSSSEDELRMAVGSHAAALAAIVPELGDRLALTTTTTTPGTADRPEQRFQVFDAVTRTLTRAATELPLVLIIDDLHWADASSLSLLEHLAAEVPRQRLLIVCAYRDVEVTRKSPLLATLGELTRIRQLERIRLTGLDLTETGSLARAIAGASIPEEIVQAIFHQTDGNPLFVAEVARVVAEERRQGNGGTIAVDVPDGVREAIGRRLNRLSASCNELLTTAAVMGREFDLRVVAEVLEQRLESCLAGLDQAVSAGLVELDDVPASRPRFTHALIRETLYDEIPTLQRLHLHKGIATALQTLRRASDEDLSQLVHHACEAAALGDCDQAVDLALQAAARDQRIFAFEEACRHYDLALSTLHANGLDRDPRAARACYAKARIQLADGHADAALASATQGAERSRDQDPELFARCVLIMARVSTNAAQDSAIVLLEEALHRVPQTLPAIRAFLLSHLAVALRDHGVERVNAAGSEAAGIARRLGDPEVLQPVLRQWAMGLRRRPETLEARLRLGRESLELVPGCSDTDETTEAHYWHLLSLLEAGAMGEFLPLLERYRHQAASLHLTRHQYQAGLLEIATRLLRGEWAGLEALMEASLDLGRRIDRHDPDGVYGAQMFQLNRELGRLRGLAPLVRRMEESDQRLWAPGLLAMYVETGLLEEARPRFEALAGDRFGSIPRDEMWLTSLVFCAEACARLGDAERAGELYELLLPYAGQTANHPAAVCFGAVAGYLGILAATAGDRVGARQHFADARELNRAMQAWPALARCQTELGRALLDDDPVEARQVLDEAERLAGHFQMAGLAEQIAELLDGGSLPDGLTPREAEVLKLLAIGRSNKDVSRALEISLSTVATHVRSIFAKTGCANRTETAAYAIKHQLN